MSKATEEQQYSIKNRLQNNKGIPRDSYTEQELDEYIEGMWENEYHEEALNWPIEKLEKDFIDWLDIAI